MTRRREHGRILDVWETALGSALSVDAEPGDLVLNVDDCSAFNDDGQGGSLQLGDQVVAYTLVDDDAGTITLAEAVTTLVEADEDVLVYSTLYDQVDTVRYAAVQVDGRRDHTNPLECVLGDGVGDLPTGQRGRAGESCVIRRDGDEWEVIRVKGRPSAAAATGGLKFEADDVHVLTAGDVAAGTVTFSLSHRPIEESLTAYWVGVFQEPTEYSIDYAGQTVTWPLDGVEVAGDRLTVHYAYRDGITTTSAGTPAETAEIFSTGGGGSSWGLGPYPTVDPADGFLMIAWATNSAPIGFTPSGLGATWAQIAGGLSSDSYCNFELDTGVAPNASSGSITVTATGTTGQTVASVRVTGADMTGPLEVEWSTGFVGTATETITPSTKSRVYGFALDRGRATAQTVPAGWTKLHEILGDAITVFSRLVEAGETVTLTTPAEGSHWFTVLVAIPGG